MCQFTSSNFFLLGNSSAAWLSITCYVTVRPNQGKKVVGLGMYHHCVLNGIGEEMVLYNIIWSNTVFFRCSALDREAVVRVLVP
jgi:hypothetical protein